MSGLHSIPTRGEPDSCPHADRGNAIPVLYEVRHALARLIAAGEETRIDLNAIPFGPGDEERLVGLLGTGEVSADVEALGPTRVQETAIPGVWLLDYRNAEGERLALHLEIASVPEILRTQREDLDTAIAALDARLQLGQGGPRLQSA
jgi:hydrogenase-1 operon protein HyaF